MTDYNTVYTDDQKRILGQHIAALVHSAQEVRDIKESDRDIYHDLKSHGFNVKAVRKVVRLISTPKEELEDEFDEFSFYRDITTEVMGI